MKIGVICGEYGKQQTFAGFRHSWKEARDIGKMISCSIYRAGFNKFCCSIQPKRMQLCCGFKN